ncbi:MAG: hypothetical protein DRO67_00215 [Candidatus Asgardarchaeum californiense]|nr:MAG: hypothetical protein DRO67_00215 [Candidatus Asgardarchaeum californiense]
MFSILFDVLFLSVIKKLTKRVPQQNAGCDVFIPFEDRDVKNNMQEKTDYYPEDFDDYGNF